MVKIKYKGYFLSVLVEIIALAGFLQSHHRVRAALFSVIEAADMNLFEWSADKAPSWFRQDHWQLYKDFLAEGREVVSHYSSEIEGYAALMQYIRGIGRDKYCGMPVNADSVYLVRDLLKNGFAGGCADFSLLFAAYLRSMDRAVRIVGLDQNDGLGGNGHAVNEVWIKDLKKWVLFDVDNSAFFTYEGIPLSVLEVRDIILQGKSSLLNVTQGNVFSMPKDKLIEEYYAPAITNVTLDGRADWIYKHEHRYGLFQVFAPVFDRLPRYMRRALTNIIGEKDLRIHLIDAYSIHYHARIYKIIFILLVLTIAINILLLMRSI